MFVYYDAVKNTMINSMSFGKKWSQNLHVIIENNIVDIFVSFLKTFLAVRNYSGQLDTIT